MKKSFIVYVILILITFMSGCDNSSQTDDSATVSADEISMEDLYAYTSEDLFDEVHFIYLAEPYDNGLYISASMTDDPYTGNIYYCDVNENTITKLDYEIDEATPLISMDVASNGDLWVVKYVQSESDGDVREGYQIDVVSKDSNEVTTFEHEVLDYFPSKIVMSDNNKIYIYATSYSDESKYIYVYNLQGERLAEIKLDTQNKSMVFSEKDNKLYVLDTNSTIYFLNEDTYTIDKLIQVESATSFTTLYESSEYSFYIDLNSILMGFDSDTSVFTPLIDWTANGVSGSIWYVIPYDEYFIGIYRDTASNMDRIVKFTETNELQSNKKTLKLATMENDEFIRFAVANFNKLSNDYNITITDYSIYGDEALQKLHTEIMAGDIPDIFDMNGLPVDEYIAKGVLEDLDPYMQADLNLDDYWESALSAIYDDEKCYLVVPSFAINTIFANSDYVTNFSYEEMLSYIKDNAYEQMNASGSGESFIRYMLSCYSEQFIDWNKKACYCESDEFIELLEIASSVDTLDEDYDDYVMINNGQQSVSFQWINGIHTIDSLAAVFHDNYSIINVGIDEDKSGAIMLPLYSFGMSSSSDYKDGAWEFLQYLYSDDAQELHGYMGISMKKSGMDAQLELFKEDIEFEEEHGITGITYVSGGVEYFIPYVDNRLDAYQTTINLINSIDRLYQTDASIMEIIEEEFITCLEGDKSAEEVANIIQNRATTYINERS